MRENKEGRSPPLFLRGATSPPTSRVLGCIVTCTLLWRIYSAFRRPTVSSQLWGGPLVRAGPPDPLFGNEMSLHPSQNRPTGASAADQGVCPTSCRCDSSTGCCWRLQDFGDLFGMPRRVGGHQDEELIRIEVTERGVGGSKSAQVELSGVDPGDGFLTGP